MADRAGLRRPAVSRSFRRLCLSVKHDTTMAQRNTDSPPNEVSIQSDTHKHTKRRGPDGRAPASPATPIANRDENANRDVQPLSLSPLCLTFSRSRSPLVLSFSLSPPPFAAEQSSPAVSPAPCLGPTKRDVSTYGNGKREKRERGTR